METPGTGTGLLPLHMSILYKDIRVWLTLKISPGNRAGILTSKFKKVCHLCNYTAKYFRDPDKVLDISGEEIFLASTYLKTSCQCENLQKLWPQAWKKYVSQKSILHFYALIRQGNFYMRIMIQYAPERKYFQDSCKRRIRIRALIGSEIQ